jgi:hypothetical protein
MQGGFFCAKPIPSSAPITDRLSAPQLAGGKEHLAKKEDQDFAVLAKI